MLSKIKQLNQNQSGLVAILVSVIIIMLLSLVTLSFSRIVNREQRQALDRQLSTQAFYAAESGVNEVAGVINKKINAGAALPEKTDCDPTQYPDGETLNNVLEPTAGIEFTCLLVNNAPLTLEFGSINTDKSEIFPVEADTNFDTITISWNAVDGAKNVSCGYPNLPPDGVPWPCENGILRLDLIPGPNGSLSRNYLIDNTFTAFLFPSPTSSATAMNSYPYTKVYQDKGPIVETKCDTTDTSLPKYCILTITGLGSVLKPGGGTGLSRFFLRLRSLYRTSGVRIEGTSGGVPVPLKNAQALVDSTGKANDVVRRIQVRMPLYSQISAPEYSLQTMDSLCKLLRVTPTTVTDGCP